VKNPILDTFAGWNSRFGVYEVSGTSKPGVMTEGEYRSALKGRWFELKSKQYQELLELRGPRSQKEF